MANFNFNKVILGGRLTADPELKVTPSGIPVTNFVLAVNRPGRDAGADFFRVNAWRKTAEFITTYFRHGSTICVTGRIHERTWTDKTGGVHEVYEVEAEQADFVDSRSERVGQVVVDPSAEVLEGAAEPEGKPQMGVYNTPGARTEIREGMAEGEPDMPF